MLSIENLKAKIDDKEILKDLNLNIKPGEVHAIMGPNGSGKSTLSNILSGKKGYEVNGTVTFEGKNLLDLDNLADSIVTLSDTQTVTGNTTQNALINITTIFLGLAVGSKLEADKFLVMETIGILALGMVAFGIGTITGIIMAKLMNLVSKTKVNPLIGAAGVSAVPMAARVANKVGLEANPQNFLLMHAMGPNVAGVIGSAVAAGILIQFAS